MYRTNSNGAVVFTAPFSLSKKSYDFSDKSHPRRAHGLSATPTNRTLARIEVFFAPGDPWQKTDFKNPLRRQLRFFRQAKRGRSFYSPVVVLFLFQTYDRSQDICTVKRVHKTVIVEIPCFIEFV